MNFLIRRYFLVFLFVFWFLLFGMLNADLSSNTIIHNDTMYSKKKKKREKKGIWRHIPNLRDNVLVFFCFFSPRNLLIKFESLSYTLSIYT